MFVILEVRNYGKFEITDLGLRANIWRVGDGFPSVEPPYGSRNDGQTEGMLNHQHGADRLGVTDS